MPRLSEHVPSSPQRDRHRRGYVACVSCKARKVKCVIEQEPPCSKCAREHRECVFNTNHATRKHREAPKWTAGAQKHTAPPPSTTTRQWDSAAPGLAGDAEIGPHKTTAEARPLPPGSASGTADAFSAPTFTDRAVSGLATGTTSEALEVLFGEAATVPTVAAQNSNSHPTRDAAGSTAQAWRSVSSPSTGPPGQYGVHVERLSQADDPILDLWDKCRFVRQGWFTAQEAVTYVDLFYKHFGPLSIAVRDGFGSHASHEKLVCEEPLLCCAIIMISSRWFMLPGPGGLARSHYIHSRLWQYCELLLHRVMLGQEKHSTGKTRILGTIEALILISDWHPRALHFPPDTEGWDAELISPGYDRRNRIHHEGVTPLIRWREDVFEPAKRYDRMSWMLLGAAVCLGFELGIYSCATARSVEDQRTDEVRKLLYIHVTQLANRLGRPTLLPENIGYGPVSVTAEVNNRPPRHVHLDLWAELTRLAKLVTISLFPSSDSIKTLISNGHYALMLEHLEPSFAKWEGLYDTGSRVLSLELRSLLEIEFHHLKVLTCGLSMQAIVERALAQGIRHVSDCHRLLESLIIAQDKKFVLQVISSGVKVLELATELSSNGILRYCPSRVLIYTTSATVFLLKALFLSKAVGPDLGTCDFNILECNQLLHCGIQICSY